jgi:adenylate cyclase
MASPGLTENRLAAHRRKLAAILCADVVGFSQLMRRDEAATYDALRRLRHGIDPLIADKSGRIVSTAGDGFLAEFASIVDALACAVEMQDLAAELNADRPPERRLDLRIGVNLGDIIIADDNDIYGDGVNIAARLEMLASPGGICLSHTVYEQVKHKLDLPYRSLGRHRVKNIAEPVQVYAIGPAAPSFPALVFARWRAAIFASVVAFLALAGLGTWLLMAPKSGEPVQPRAPEVLAATKSATASNLAQRISVAVLPFKDLSAADGQNSMAESLGEAVANALGRFSIMLVVGRSATMALPDRARTPQEASRALGVHYLVEGSIRRTGDRLRITAELSDAASGRQLWSDSHDTEARDPFAAMDDAARRIAGAANAALTRAEHDRVLQKPLDELAPYEYLLRARADFTAHSRDKNEEARTLARRAIDLDANYGEAYAALGWAYYEAVASGWSDFPQDDIEQARALAQKAAGLDAASSSAYNLLAGVFLYYREFDRALAQSDRALEINPNDAGNLGHRSTVLIGAGRPAEALKWAEEALRLDRASPPVALVLGQANYLLGHYEAAIQSMDRALARDPGRRNQLAAHSVLAACYARLGRTQDAERERMIVMRLSPFFSSERFAAELGSEEGRQNMLAGLREAGFR